MSWTVRPGVSSFVAGIGTKFAFDVTRFPKLPNLPLIGGGMSGYAASAQSANAAVAAKFVEFIVSPTGQKIFEATGNSVPVLKSLQGDTTWLKLPRPDFNNQAYYYDNANDTLPPTIPVSAQSAYDTAMSDAFTSVFLAKASVKDAFAKAADTVNSALQGA
jgi:ABC-type glycerol-3-phosphate transport system substrate-binding protein